MGILLFGVVWKWGYCCLVWCGNGDIAVKCGVEMWILLFSVVWKWGYCCLVWCGNGDIAV